MKKICAITGLALGLISLEARAFLYISGNNYAKGARPLSAPPVWPARKISFLINPNLSAYGGSRNAGFTSQEFIDAITNAVGAWAAACRADLTVAVAGTTGSTVNANDGVNVISFDTRTQAQGNYFGGSITVLAAATTVLSGDDYTDCDITVNGNAGNTNHVIQVVPDPNLTNPLDANGNPAYDLQSILTHEIGHCIGLDHPIEPGVGPTNYDSSNPFLQESTMVQSGNLPDWDITRRTINQDDRDGTDCLYERGRPFSTGSQCSSYHGTNGVGSIEGNQNITGGPTSEEIPPVCIASGDIRTVAPNLTKSGMSCVSSAVARSPATDALATRWDDLMNFLFQMGLILSVQFSLILLRKRKIAHKP